MAKDSVYNLLQKPVGEHGRNVFPLDNRHAYSMKAGQITPIKCFHYKPGDYFDIEAHDFSLTFPMNTAAFLRGRKEFSFYSIYYNAVWSLYNQYQATRMNPKSSAFGQDPYLAEPRMRIIDLLMACLDQWAHLMYAEYYVKRYYGVGSLRSWLNGSFGKPWKMSATFNISESSYFLRFPSVVRGFFNRIYFANPFNIPVTSDSSMATRTYVLDAVGQFRAYNWLRKLDMLGYGNYYPFFSAAEKLVSDIDSEDVFETDFTRIVVDLGASLIDTTTQYDGHNLPDYDDFVIKAEKTYNLYPICAYNACFYHFFRNSYYDNDYYSHNYNLDFVSVAKTHGNINLLICGDFDLRFLDIEYHQWKKDRFTGVLPDQQFGAVSGLTISSVQSSDTFVTGSTDANGKTFSSVSQNNSSRVLGTTPDSVNSLFKIRNLTTSGTFDVVALKRAEMLQDYRQQLMRAGNKTTDIFRALYGKECSSEHVDDVIPRFLDTFGEDIFVDPVIATADTGSQNQNGSLGDLSARGKFSGSSGRIKFNAGGNFGLILCMSYVVPTAEYNSYIVDKHLMELSPEAHYIPQFENLGLEDIYNFELNCLLPYNDVQSLGKVPRYHHKKGEVDQVHGAFCSLPYNYISGSSTSHQILSFAYGGWVGQFNHWVSPRSELQGRLSTTIRDFYINPSVLDNVFVRAAGYDQADDQFICSTYFEVKSTKELSKIGLLNFV